MKCVCQSTLNLTRGRLVIQNYSETGNILSVEKVNQMEPVIFSCFSKKKIIIGAKYENEENLIPFSDKGKRDLFYFKGIAEDHRFFKPCVEKKKVRGHFGYVSIKKLTLKNSK